MSINVLSAGVLTSDMNVVGVSSAQTVEGLSERGELK
jgi:hypothetical protein